MYCVQASRIICIGSVYQSEQLPTFYLDENVQGIVDAKHAEEIARAIVGATDCDVRRRFSIHCEKV